MGESGCGKSLTGLALLRLVPPPGRVDPSSVIRLEGTDLMSLDEAAMRGVRGGRIGMVFQDPMTSLNPVLTSGDQIAEAVRAHRRCRGALRWHAPRRCWARSVSPILRGDWESIRTS